MTYFVVTRFTQQKSFKENKGSVEREQTITGYSLIVILYNYNSN